MSQVTALFQQSIPVRIVLIDSDPWFVAADISNALGYPSAPQMTRNLDADEKGMQIVHTLGGTQRLSVISESGLYEAVFGSRKPEAKKFRKWVTSEVLPSIRKTGSYSVKNSAPNAITKQPVQTTYFTALRLLVGSDPALWIGLTELVFDRIGISSIKELSHENIDPALAVLKEDAIGDQYGWIFAEHYRMAKSILIGALPPSRSPG